MFYKTTAWTTLASAVAAVASQPETRAGHRVHATFEDITTIPAIGLLTPSGPYHGLDIDGFEYLQLGVGGLVLTGLKPKSDPNAIATGLQDKLLHGPPTFKVAKGTKSFDLESFYFGCALDTAASALSVAPGCKVIVTGYDEHGHGVANEEVNFKPDSLSNEMTKATLKEDFKNLHRVEFFTSNPLEALIAIILDDVDYVIYN